HAISFAAFLITAFLAASILAEDAASKYPETKRADQVDDFHGTKVADPYRWLEDDVRKSTDVKGWVEAQNKVTEAYLKTITERETIHKRLTELWNYEKVSAPVKYGGRYFFTRNDGLQNQAVLFVQESLDAAPRMLLDPNTWTKDGTAALGAWVASDD